MNYNKFQLYKNILDRKQNGRKGFHLQMPPFLSFTVFFSLLFLMNEIKFYGKFTEKTLSQVKKYCILLP